MVVKMMKWSPWPPVPTTSKKFQVKVKPIKLEFGSGFINGFETNIKEEDEKKKEVEEEEEEKVVRVEMKWKGPKIGLPGLRRASNRGRNVSSERILRDIIEWSDKYDDEFERVLNFSMFQKDNSPSFNPWDVSFNLLCGQKGEVRNKFVVIGKVSLNIAELASQMEAQIEKKLPIAVRVAGVSSEASLLISLSFVEIRTDSVETVQEAASVSDREDGFFRRVLSRSKSKKKKKKIDGNETEEANVDRGLKTDLVESDESTLFDSDGSPDNSLVSTQPDSIECIPVANNKEEEESSLVCCSESDKEASSMSQLSQTPSPEENRLDSVSKVGFWKKRKLSFRSFKKKEEKIVPDNAEVDQSLIGPTSVDSTSSSKITNDSSTSNIRKQELSIGNWEEQELISRDGQTKLKASIFAASIDQRSQKAAGESACTALVALLANWLQTNPEKMPTLSELDNLITEGSSEWRKLCHNKTYITRFPDRHFDLETILEANLRPLSVNPDKSFIGFFCPESFESLKGAMSFDAMWEEISSTTTTNHIDGDQERDKQPQVYIVSWNDHFFVLKVESDAYYVIDTLGERLFEGCNQAYILKFDKDAIVYDLSKKVDENAVGGGDPAEMSSSEEGKEMMVWKGKECCREFIKRFLAAIPLRELEVEEKKGTLATITLHQRLQIEFHFSTTSTSTTSSLSASCD